MNTFDLIEALQDLPDALVEDALAAQQCTAESAEISLPAAAMPVQQTTPAETPVPIRHIPRSIVWGSVAACLLFAVGFCAFFLRGDGITQQPDPADSIVELTAVSQTTTVADTHTTVTTTAVTQKPKTVQVTTYVTDNETARTESETVTETTAAQTASPQTDTPEAPTETTVTHAPQYEIGDVNMDGVVDQFDAILVNNDYTYFFNGRDDYRLSPEQEALANVTGGPGIYDGPDRYLPFDPINAQIILNYYFVSYMEPNLTVTEYAALPREEQLAKMKAFEEKYRAVQDESSDPHYYVIVPADTPKGKVLNGVFYQMGDVNMNGEIDINDAELIEEAVRIRSEGGTVENTGLLLGTITGRRYCQKDADVIRIYLELKDAGVEVPEDITVFYEQYKNKEYDRYLE